MPLYGHELSESIDPFEAGLGFACHLVGYDFPGRDALKTLQSQPPRRVRIGLVLEGRRVAREGYAVLCAGRPVGRGDQRDVFAFAGSDRSRWPMCRPTWRPPGTALEVDVRGRLEPARVVSLPFYQRPTKGVRR